MGTALYGSTAMTHRMGEFQQLAPAITFKHKDDERHKENRLQSVTTCRIFKKWTLPQPFLFALAYSPILGQKSCEAPENLFLVQQKSTRGFR
jgi:hypothetical protein